MLKHNLKCFPLQLYLIHLVQGVTFYNPPKFHKDPIVFKILERSNKLVFEKLNRNVAGDLVSDLKTKGFESKTTILNALKKQETVNRYGKQISNDVKFSNNFQNILKKHQNDKLKGLKKVLVKRFVPRNYVTGNLEYDHIYKSYFKPLVRIPAKSKKLDRNKDVKQQDKYSKKEKDFRDEDLLEPFKLEIEKLKRFSKSKKQKEELANEDVDRLREEVVDLVQEIQTVLKKVKSPKLKLRTFQKVLDVLNDIEGLRSTSTRQNDNKSGERNPNESPFQEQVPANEVVPPAFDTPYHHMFQYWIYNKNIHQDGCPGDKIKIGNVCSWVPPH